MSLLGPMFSFRPMEFFAFVRGQLVPTACPSRKQILNLVLNCQISDPSLAPFQTLFCFPFSPVPFPPVTNKNVCLLYGKLKILHPQLQTKMHVSYIEMKRNSSPPVTNKNVCLLYGKLKSFTPIFHCLFPHITTF